MEWIFEYVEDGKYIRVVTKGVFSASVMREKLQELTAQPYWGERTPVLFDNREMNFSAAGAEAIREASKYHIFNDALIGSRKTAFLMGSLADFGLGRQYEIITEQAVSANVSVFMDEQKALDWLLAE